jgi:hypothetical protein
MPRRTPFVESDLLERDKFGFGPVEDARAPGKLAIYDEAARSLAVNKDLRTRFVGELNCILRLYSLEIRVERQQTSGRKAQAFQKERRWWKRRERISKRLQKLVAHGDDTGARRVLAELQRTPRLPAALEQEVWRRVLNGRSHDAALSELSREPSSPGRIRSYVLMHVVRRLQELASRYGKELAWTTGDRPPYELVKFIRDTLYLAGVKCPDERHQDRLVALMVAPHALADTNWQLGEIERAREAFAVLLAKTFHSWGDFKSAS